MTVFKRRWFRWSLRTMFVAVTAAAILAALLVSTWRHARSRLEYVNSAGAVKGDVRTMQGYKTHVNRWRVSWWIFGDQDVEKIWLTPGNYDDVDLAYIRDLFPEAKIQDYDEDPEW